MNIYRRAEETSGKKKSFEHSNLLLLRFEKNSTKGWIILVCFMLESESGRYFVPRPVFSFFFLLYFLHNF